MEHSTHKKKGLSDDMLDGITAVLLIAVVTAGVSFWLSTLSIA